MVWKKVNNSDAGDSTHFGGDDVDKISETFNAGTQTDPINIKDENLYIVDPADTSKKVRFDAGGVTSSSTVVITVPDANITLASTTAASTSVAGLMSAADKSKLDAIEASATADQTGAQIKTAYEAETNAFTDTLFSKLNAIEASATADQTDAEIRTAVEAATDSNVFTDVDHSKLNNIEANATADQTNAEIRTAVGAATDSNVFTDANVTTLGNRAPLASPTFTGTVNAADITLSGNLTVNGTSTTVDTATLSVEDPLIKLASGNNAADSVDVGFYGLYDVGGTDKYAGIVRDASDSGKFIAFKDLQTEPTTTVDKSATGYAVATIVADIEGDVTGTLTGNASGLSATLAVASGGTGVTSKTGTGNVVLSTSPTLVTPVLGTPAAGSVLTNCTGLPATTGLTATGTKDATTFLRGDDTWAVVDASPLTTKGDVYTFDTGNQRLAVGADGLVLKADSSTATGLVWGSGGGGATATHAYTNQSSTSYTGTGSAGTGIDVGVAVATEASGAGEREIYIKKIDANNEGVFTVIHKNGAAVEVQIA